MQREIKFDYILKNNIGFHHKVYTIKQLEQDNLIQLFDIDNYQLIARREFTGLQDKNGLDIYVGDVIEYIPKYGDKTKRKAEIFFSAFRASFSYKNSDFANNDLFSLVQNGNVVEVIGNIHQNPELLVEN